ncbi:MAG: glycerophosphodiester phosphodiesterase [Gammaproteobacteria bacterium]|nr:glycerophosphodiester phosphodiesterase [Gammaproteobacteria bacterium]
MQRPLVIAHRGASGYLPEHTLAAKALAAGMGADYLEQDVVATRDGALIVFHDLTLEDTTDVRDRYPTRARSDGHWYAIDFTLEEIRRLSAGERRQAGTTRPRFTGRYPDGAGRFGIVTLDEELAFIRGLNRSSGRAIGIYPEIKDPGWHRLQGVEIGDRLLEVLTAHGYSTAACGAYLQCFDAEELQRLRGRTDLPLIQLLDSAGGIPSAHSLRQLASYAQGIGPSLKLVLGSRLVAEAHGEGLLVHPYTARRDDLPPGVHSFDQLLQQVLADAGSDGVFTDFPDLVVDFIRRRFPAGE